MRQDSGAFVFGSMSFCDKLAGGVAILVIQLFCPCAYVMIRILLVTVADLFYFIFLNIFADVLLQLYNTLVLPYLTYCNMIWTAASESLLNKLVRPRWPYDMRPSAGACRKVRVIVIR